MYTRQEAYLQIYRLQLQTLQFYRNGIISTPSAVQIYDVYYYNEALKTVWIYANSVTGRYTAASPSTANPTSATVAGNTYTLESAAAYKLSDLGSYTIGDTVTLLLGKRRNGCRCSINITFQRKLCGYRVKK